MNIRAILVRPRPVGPVLCRKGRIIAAIAAAWLWIDAAPALAQLTSQQVTSQQVTSQKVTWQMGTEYPQTSISGVGLTTFTRLLATHTNDIVVARTSFDNELKISSGQMLEAALQGRIAGGDAFAGPLQASDAIFGLATLPFVVQSIDMARIVNAKARPLYEKALEARGLKLLYITIWPSTGLWSDQPLENADDLGSLVVRTYDTSSAEVMRAAGARAEYMPLSEAMARLRDHRLNAILTSGDGGVGQRLWEYLRYFTPINYATPISLTFVRADAFQALPKDLQQQVLAAAAETEKSQLDLLSNRTAENYARMRANGVTIAEPVPAPILATLRRGAVAPVAAWKAKVPAEAVAIVDWVGQQ